MSAQNIASVEEFIAHNEHECAYDVIRNALEEADVELPSPLKAISDKLERRFYAKD